MISAARNVSLEVSLARVSVHRCFCSGAVRALSWVIGHEERQVAILVLHRVQAYHFLATETFLERPGATI